LNQNAVTSKDRKLRQPSRADDIKGVAIISKLHQTMCGGCVRYSLPGILGCFVCFSRWPYTSISSRKGSM